MVAQLVIELVAAGAVVSTENGRLVCRVPKGQRLPPELANRVGRHKEVIMEAIDEWDLGGTVQALLALPSEQWQAWEAAHAHDTAAYSLVCAARQE